MFLVSATRYFDTFVVVCNVLPLFCGYWPALFTFSEKFVFFTSFACVSTDSFSATAWPRASCTAPLLVSDLASARFLCFTVSGLLILPLVLLLGLATLLFLVLHDPVQIVEHIRVSRLKANIFLDFHLYLHAHIQKFKDGHFTYVFRVFSETGTVRWVYL